MIRELIFFLGVICSIEASALPMPAKEAGDLIPGAPPSDSVPTPYDQGLRALLQNDLPVAEAAFRKALASNPNAVPPLLGLAEVAFKRKKLDDAGKYIKQAVAKEPDNPFVQSSLGRYLTLTRHFGEAEVALTKAARLDPKSAHAQVDLGDFYATVVNKPKEAAMAYEAATRADPSHAGAHYALGVTLAKLGESEKALPVLEKAVQLASGNPLPLVALSRVRAARGDLAGALKAVDAALNIQPGLAAARELRGDILSAKGDSSAALKDYETLLRSQPEAAPVQVKAGMLYQAAGRHSDAVRAYKAAITVDPRFALAYNNVAWLVASRKQDLRQAEIWAKRAVELAPKVAQFRDTLGWIYRENGKRQESVSALQEASRISPSDPSIHYHLGVVLAESGNTAQAKEALVKALKLSPSFPEAAEAKRLLNTLPR